MKPDDIKAAPAGAVIKDNVVPGLQLRAFAGRKAFYLYYRTKGGRQRKPKLGDWPTLALPRAREIARKMLDQVAAGGDPQGVRELDRTAPTVADLCDRYMLEHGTAKKSDFTDRSLIERHIKPRLGNERVADLDFNAVSTFHKTVPAKVRANRALALLSTALNMAERWGWRPVGSNPCKHVRRNKEQRRRRYMTADEASAVADGLRRHAAERPEAVAFLYLLIYTGARKGEIAGARWKDLDGDVLRLADSKGGGPRTIHLPHQVVDIIAGLPRTANGTICGIQNPYKTWYTIREEAGCPDLRMHDLRHSFASAALAAGKSLAQIGELLGHKSAQTTKGYAHLMEDIARQDAADAAALIESRLNAPRSRKT